MMRASAIIALSILSGAAHRAYCLDLGFRAQFDRDRSEIKLIWSNEASSEPTLVNLGDIAGKLLRLSVTTRMYLSGPGLTSGDLVDVREPAGIAGRLIPFVICLLPESEYALTLEARYLRIPGSTKTLADVLDRPWTLFVSFIGKSTVTVGRRGNFVPYDGVSEYGIKLPFWTGKSKSIIRN